MTRATATAPAPLNASASTTRPSRGLATDFVSERCRQREGSCGLTRGERNERAIPIVKAAAERDCVSRRHVGQRAASHPFCQPRYGRCQRSLPYCEEQHGQRAGGGCRSRALDDSAENEWPTAAEKCDVVGSVTKGPDTMVPRLAEGVRDVVIERRDCQRSSDTSDGFLKVALGPPRHVATLCDSSESLRRSLN